MSGLASINSLPVRSDDMDLFAADASELYAMPMSRYSSS
jgi:hypothetical protein